MNATNGKFATENYNKKKQRKFLNFKRKNGILSPSIFVFLRNIRMVQRYIKLVCYIVFDSEE